MRMNAFFKMRSSLFAPPLLLFALFSTLIISCGIHDKTPSLREAAQIKKRIAVPLFTNATFEPVLEKELTRIFKSSFYQKGWTVEDHSAKNRLTLLGKIIAYTHRPTSLTPTGQARAYQIRIDVEIRLLQGSNQAEPRIETLSGISDYLAKTNPAAERAAKDRAIREAGEEMASRLAILIQPLRHPSSEPAFK